MRTLIHERVGQAGRGEIQASSTRRARFLLDVTLVGDALLRVTSTTRINYSLFGNTEATLHAQVTPLYNSEP